MKEVVKDIDMTVTGEVTIRKFDSNGNCNYEWTGKNLVKDIVGVIAKRWWRSLYSAWCPGFNAEITRPQSSYADIIKYAYLVNTTVTPDATKDNVFPFDTVIGYCNKSSQTIGADPTVGILNSTESYQSNDNGTLKVKLKYEWGLSKANGTFNSLLHAMLPVDTILTGKDTINNDKTLQYGLKPYDNAGLFTVNIASNGNRIVYHTMSLVDDGLGTKKLVLKRKDMTTGTDLTDLELTEWRSKYGTSLPSNVVMTLAGTKLVFCFAGGALSTVIYVIDGSSHYIVSTSQSGAAGISIDATYIYTRPGSSRLLYRYAHTGITANATVTLTEWIDTPFGYTYIVDNKAFIFNENTYYDLTGANWSTHATLTATKHNYCYVNAGDTQCVDNSGTIYYRRVNNQYSTLNSTNEVAEQAIHYQPLMQPKQIETTHVKFPAITKTNAETLSIDYTFTFA